MSIMILGDVIEDRYIYCRAERISPEAPMPVFEMIGEEFRSGGAGNVLANLRALGSEPTAQFVPCTSTKTRYVCEDKIVFRFDDEKIVEIDVDTYDYTGYNDYIVLSDYNKGALTDTVEMIARFNQNGSRVIVDAKKPAQMYKGAWLLKMNGREAKKFIEHEDYREMMLDFRIDNLLITRGEWGMDLIMHREGSFFEKHIDVREVSVADVTGAGDVVTAVVAHFLDRGEGVVDAARKAARLATRSVSKFGTYVLTEKDVRSVKPKVVFTNGCFDILHAGHIELLRQSKRLGDKLIVGLNSDSSVAGLKGPGRPINSEDDRADALRSLKWVDQVVLFDEPTPIQLIREIKPDIITKGGDYAPEEVVGNNIAEVVIIPTLEGYSTTNIIQKVKSDE
jgi:D-beta-D-heptose 7-phosphate kinase/D-beta-D-heptose 1-phosphate adenosyltransferase